MGMLSALIQTHWALFVLWTLHCLICTGWNAGKCLAHVITFSYKRGLVKLKSARLNPISAPFNGAISAWCSCIYVCLKDYVLLLLGAGFDSKELMEEKTKCLFVSSLFKNVVPMPWHSCHSHKRGSPHRKMSGERNEATAFSVTFPCFKYG